MRRWPWRSTEPSRGRFDQPLVFDGSPSSDQDQDALSYQWDFGDGTSASGAVVTHSFELPGTYTALLTVSDGVLSSPPYPVSVTITAADPGENTAEQTARTCTDSFNRSNDPANLGVPDGGACPPGSLRMPVVGALFINADKASSAALKGLHVAVLPSIAGMNQTVEADFTSIEDNNPSPRFGLVLRHHENGPSARGTTTSSPGWPEARRAFESPESPMESKRC